MSASPHQPFTLPILSSFRDLQREIDVCQKQLPKVKEHEEELAALTEQLDDERWRVQLLEEDLVDPKNDTRWRKLGPVKKGVGESV